MSSIGERMIAKPYKRFLDVLAVGALAIAVVVVPFLILDFVERLEWSDYVFDRGGTCETIQCGNVKGASIDTNQWP
jgi:hypothetical protein